MACVRTWSLEVGSWRDWHAVSTTSQLRTTRKLLELRAVLNRYSSQFKDNYFTEMCCGNEVGSYLRRIDSFITQLKAQGPSRTCNESKAEEEEEEEFNDIGASISTGASVSLFSWPQDENPATPCDSLSRRRPSVPMSSEHGTYKTVKARS